MAMRWSTKQRMAFIKDHLAKVGKINRSDIMEHFEVSAAQAAADFRQFERLHPVAMRYDNGRKTYIAINMGIGGRDTTAAAKTLMYADDTRLELIAHRDPGMIRDVAAALIYERPSSKAGETR